MARKPSKKVTVIEENAKDAPQKDLEWEAEQITAKSTTKITDDKGVGESIVLRFFSFAANPEKFHAHQPDAQHLFNEHIKGMESLLWGDGLKPHYQVQPRILFSVDGMKYEPFSPKGKQYKFYQFVLPCIPTQTLIDTPMTLSQLLTNSKR